MKKLLLILPFLLLGFLSIAQVPQKMSYQAVVRNASNALVINASVGMQISILQGSATGTAVYVETQNPTTNDNGLVSLEIGNGTIVSGVFASIDWANGPFFIKTETDPLGGSNYTIVGTSQLLSVPYAMYAETSGSSLPGPQGPAGPQGIPGNDGVPGLQGPQGPVGSQGSFPLGNNFGNMLFWNDSIWQEFPIGNNGEALVVCNGVPLWGGCSASIATDSASLLFQTVKLYGNVVDDGGSFVVVRGFCYSLVPNPTISDLVVSSGVGMGLFSVTLTNLPPSSSYYFRSFCIGVGGTVTYGSELSFISPSELTLGGNGPGGGLIFYLDGNGGGLEAAPFDQSIGMEWGCPGLLIPNCNGLMIGQGVINTSSIVNNCIVQSIAAKACFNFSFGGYSDWFLPSNDELLLMYDNLHLNGLGSFQNQDYWSSSQVDEQMVWGRGFYDGNYHYLVKSTLYPVRAIRSF